MDDEELEDTFSMNDDGDEPPMDMPDEIMEDDPDSDDDPESRYH